MKTTKYEVEEWLGGKGWTPLVAEALALVEATNGVVEIMDIKEKFGGLRIATTYHYDDEHDGSNFDFETFAMSIMAIEQKSLCTCRKCGKPGHGFNRNGWWDTLCNTCYLANRLYTGEY